MTNCEPEIQTRSENDPKTGNDVPDVKQNAPKSLLSRFSVQSVSENGDIKCESQKPLDQNESSQNFSYEQPIISMGSSNRLPKITEDVSLA